MCGCSSAIGVQICLATETPRNAQRFLQYQRGHVSHSAVGSEAASKSCYRSEPSRFVNNLCEGIIQYLMVQKLYFILNIFRQVASILTLAVEKSVHVHCPLRTGSVNTWYKWPHAGVLRLDKLCTHLPPVTCHTSEYFSFPPATKVCFFTGMKKYWLSQSAK